MRLSQVGYLTDDQGKEYARGLTQADTLPKLIAFLEGWEGLADDALVVAKKMSEKDFRTFRKCLKIERSGKFSGEAHAAMVGPLAMPELMFRASVTAQRFTVPWGTAVIRIKEVLKK